MMKLQRTCWNGLKKFFFLPIVGVKKNTYICLPSLWVWKKQPKRISGGSSCRPWLLSSTPHAAPCSRQQAFAFSRHAGETERRTENIEKHPKEPFWYETSCIELYAPLLFFIHDGLCPEIPTSILFPSTGQCGMEGVRIAFHSPARKTYGQFQESGSRKGTGHRLLGNLVRTLPSCHE